MAAAPKCCPPPPPSPWGLRLTGILLTSSTGAQQAAKDEKTIESRVRYRSRVRLPSVGPDPSLAPHRKVPASQLLSKCTIREFLAKSDLHSNEMALLLKSRVALPCRSVVQRSVVRPMCVARPQLQRAAATATHKDSNLWLTSIAIAAPFLDVLPAMAKDGEFGILEGRTAALVHPAMEFIILGASLYAAYLGWQWRRTRELGEEIRALKAAAPTAAEGAVAPNPVIEQKEQVCAGSRTHRRNSAGSPPPFAPCLHIADDLAVLVAMFCTPAGAQGVDCWRLP